MMHSTRLSEQNIITDFHNATGVTRSNKFSSYDDAENFTWYFLFFLILLAFIVFFKHSFVHRQRSDPDDE